MSTKKQWFYGMHAVRAVLLNHKRVCHRIWIQARKDGTDHPLYALAQRHHQRHKQGRLDIVSQKQLVSVLPPHSVHQGIAVEVSPLTLPPWKDYCQGKKMLVMLDHVQDPHNIGAIIRSSWLFGVDAVLTTDRHSPALDGITAKAACGGVEYVPLFSLSNIHHAILFLKKEGFHCIGLDMHGDITLPSLHSHPLPPPYVVVMGQEGKGLRRLTRTSCDSLVSIPHLHQTGDTEKGDTHTSHISGAGEASEASLNVSVSAGIVLYALTAQNPHP